MQSYSFWGKEFKNQVVCSKKAKENHQIFILKIWGYPISMPRISNLQKNFSSQPVQKCQERIEVLHV